MRWALQLRREVGGLYFKLGVASDAFSGYAECVPKQSWFFQDNFKFANGRVSSAAAPSLHKAWVVHRPFQCNYLLRLEHVSIAPCFPRHAFVVNMAAQGGHAAAEHVRC